MNDWTIIKVLSWTEDYFKKHSIESPRLTAQILLSHCLGIKQIDLYLQHDRPLHKKELSDYKGLIKRRRQNEPVAYITGEKGFFESEFDVEKGVLIPRPDTETIVETALNLITTWKENFNPKRILELGTGSGAIIISLAKAIPDHLYFAGDISFLALSTAQKNARRIVKERINFFAGSWLTSLNKIEKFDLIISNPPYISTRDIQGLEPEIKQFEPLLALDGGKDGFDSFRAILKEAHNYLVPGGTLLFEMGFDQKKGLAKILSQYPQYTIIDFIKDLAGHSRGVLIKKIN